MPRPSKFGSMGNISMNSKNTEETTNDKKSIEKEKISPTEKITTSSPKEEKTLAKNVQTPLIKTSEKAKESSKKETKQADKTKQPLVNNSVKLPQDEADLLHALSLIDRENKSDIIRRATSEYLEKYFKENPEKQKKATEIIELIKVTRSI